LDSRDGPWNIAIGFPPLGYRQTPTSAAFELLTLNGMTIAVPKIQNCPICPRLVKNNRAKVALSTRFHGAVDLIAKRTGMLAETSAFKPVSISLREAVFDGISPRDPDKIPAKHRG
jgi:hypothetical protein